MEATIYAMQSTSSSPTTTTFINVLFLMRSQIFRGRGVLHRIPTSRITQ